tara:strand:- start:11575 stop:13299 length:1725 start_codon:yes stop_codon:yes gene_type:complete
MKNKYKKIISILSAQQKKTLIFLSSLLILSIGFEVVSLALLSGFLDLVSGKELHLFKKIYNYLKDIDINFSFLLDIKFTFLLLIICFCLKNFLMIVVNYKEGKFINDLKKRVSVNLYKSYIYKNYDYFFSTKLADITRNLTIEINHFSNSVGSIIKIIINFSIFFSIFLFLFFHNFFVTVNLFFIFLIFGLGFFYFNSVEIKNLGRDRPLLIAERLKIINETFANIKFLKLKKNNLFLENFVKTNSLLAYNGFKTIFLNSLARPVFEIFILILLFVIFIFASSKNINFMNITSNLILYLVAGYRAMPALNSLIINFQNLHFNIQGIDIIHDIFSKDVNENKELKENLENYEKIKFDKDIEFKDVSFFYKTDKIILKKINLKINKFEHIGFIGKSGSGKTTLTDLLIGLIQPKAGNILIDGKDFDYRKKLNWQKNIGFVPQEIYLDNSTIIENIAYGIKKENIDLDKIYESLKLANLTNFVKNLPENIYSNVGENGILLSGGQKQRIGIARALYSNPEILIFDECTSSLDEATELEILNEINLLKKTKTLITISHNDNVHKFCDKIFEINQGNLK